MISKIQFFSFLTVSIFVALALTDILLATVTCHYDVWTVVGPYCSGAIEGSTYPFTAPAANCGACAPVYCLDGHTQYALYNGTCTY